MTRLFRIGQIVPSSNITMEREVPAILRRRELETLERFSFHSARIRMTHVTREALAAMDRDSGRCALELSDARVDVIAYACLVAIMSQGFGFHRSSEARLAAQLAGNGAPAPVVTSAGALIDALNLMKARRIAMVSPYSKPLARLVVDYIEHEGINVKDYVALEVVDNLAVGALDPMHLVETYKRLDLRGIDALVLSACVQMPSLPAVPVVEEESGIPVLTAAIATTFQILTVLGLDPVAPAAGYLLSGAFARPADAVEA
jgi:maleate isomerase